VHVIVSDWDGPMGDLDFDGVRDDVPNSIMNFQGTWIHETLTIQECDRVRILLVMILFLPNQILWSTVSILSLAEF
jgi:hypothetical protein